MFVQKTGPLGRGGSSSGRLWNFGLTAMLPLTGIVARRVTNAAGCSLLGNLFSFCYLSGFLSNSGWDPS